jgi:hypothetical protein
MVTDNHPLILHNARYMITLQLFVEEFFFATNTTVEQSMKGGRVVVMACVT